LPQLSLPPPDRKGRSIAPKAVVYAEGGGQSACFCSVEPDENAERIGAIRTEVRPLLFLSLICLSCAAPQRATKPATSAAPTASANPWATQTWEDHHDTMTWVVLPNMARAFQQFQGTALPELSCFTCHGADAEKVSYAMPHGLPPLDPAHMPRRDSANPRQARFVAFMEDEVLPRFTDMTEDPTVSCFTCHPKAGSK
jgi:hypothetical protein